MDIKYIEETIRTAIYEIFPTTKVEITYVEWDKPALKILTVRIRYFCYGDDNELTIRYTNETFDRIRCKEFVDTLIDKIHDDLNSRIAEKEAEYAAKR